MIRRETPHPIFSYLIYFGCLVSFCTVTFNVDIGRNIFFVASYLAFIAFILNLKYYTRKVELLYAPISCIAVGLACILWIEAYKQPGDYITIYRAYMVTGKLLIATGFVLLISLNERIDFKKLLKTVVIALGLAANSYAIYQSIVNNQLRVELNFDRATIAAYVITAIDLVMLYSLLHINKKHRIILFTLGFAMCFITIIHTQTRAAIMMFPIISVIMFLCDKNINRQQKTISCVSILILILFSAFFLKGIIQQRVEAFKTDMNDMNELSQTQRDNSIGSRLSMYKVGIAAGNQHVLGQSAEQRSAEIATIVQQQPLLAGALPYTTVHMHNELIETYSLRGIWGCVLLIVMYVSLLLISLKSQKNTLLFAVTLSLIMYGLSDVLFFSSEATVIYGLAVIFSVLIGNNTFNHALISENERNANH
ncbi:O-antigen ligase family protein [Ewingella americana]|uniref:Ligase n=1 Tax=Ewingella americana TaxID=41202 RepID=A0A502G5V4_9GAMM|nr:O-antigen ligase family protein [Ewingella americana]TPG57305.1 ligase [Ewingella americana]